MKKQKAQLSQRDRATLYVNKFMLCFMNYGRLQTEKVTFNIIQRALTLVPFDRPHTIFISLPLRLCFYLARFPRYCHLFPKI